MRPVNWRRYCATPELPLLEGADRYSSSLAAPDPDGDRSGGSGIIDDIRLAGHGVLPPVCLLFALCEGGGGVGSRRRIGGVTPAGIGVGELQPLIWQLLELTLRPPDTSALLAEDKAEAACAFAPSRSSRNRSGGTVGGTVGDEARAGPGATAEEDVELVDEEAPKPTMEVGTRVPTDSFARAKSPAELLIAQGLAGTDTLVEMAQDLLMPAAGAEERKRCALVLRHLWAASPTESKPEVRRFLFLKSV